MINLIQNIVLQLTVKRNKSVMLNFHLMDVFWQLVIIWALFMSMNGMEETLNLSIKKLNITVTSNISIFLKTATLFIQLVGLMNFFSGKLKLENKKLQEQLKLETKNGPPGT